VLEQMRRWYPRLACVTTLTHADKHACTQLLGPSSPPVRVIPNVGPRPAPSPPPDPAPVVVAAGRLVAMKRYDLLIDAFSTVVARHPEWRLHIYGVGPMRAALSQQIEELGLTGTARLMAARQQSTSRSGTRRSWR